MQEWYRKKYEEAVAKREEAREAGDFDEYSKWETEAANYLKMMS